MSTEMTAAEALWAVMAAEPNCASVHHPVKDRHGALYVCPVVDRWSAALPILAAAVEERDDLRSELARVREALEYHGRHGERCAHVFNLVTHADMCRGVRAPECNCGFAAALSPAAPKEENNG